MHLPTYYHEWFNFTCPNTKVNLDKGRLVVQLFNVCQGSIDVGSLWNQHFDRVLGNLGFHLTMRDLVAHAKNRWGIGNIKCVDRKYASLHQVTSHPF